MISLLLAAIPTVAAMPQIPPHHAMDDFHFDELVAALSPCNPSRANSSLEGGSGVVSSVACVLKQASYPEPRTYRCRFSTCCDLQVGPFVMEELARARSSTAGDSTKS